MQFEFYSLWVPFQLVVFMVFLGFLPWVLTGSWQVKYGVWKIVLLSTALTASNVLALATMRAFAIACLPTDVSSWWLVLSLAVVSTLFGVIVTEVVSKVIPGGLYPEEPHASVVLGITSSVISACTLVAIAPFMAIFGLLQLLEEFLSIFS